MMLFRIQTQLLFLISFCSTAWPQIVTIEIPKPKSEYLYKVGEKEQGNGVANALSAVRSYNVDGGKCSLVVTSKSCYALTAAHCFQRLLSDQGKVDWQILWEGKTPLKMGFMKDGALPAQLPINSTIKMRYLKGGEPSRFVQDGKATTLNSKVITSFGVQRQLDLYNLRRPEGTEPATGIEYSIEDVKASVVAVGRGFANRTIGLSDFEIAARSSTDSNSLNGVMSDYDSFYKYTRDSRTLELADFALLKLPEDNCSCVKAGQLNEGDSVAVAGFSRDAKGTAAVDRLLPDIDYGHQTTTVPYAYGEQCKVLGDQGELVTRNLNLIGKVVVYSAIGWHLRQGDESYKAMFKHLNDRVIVTDAKAAPGASGGAMLNGSNGHLVGITTLNLAHMSGMKTSGLRIQEIKDQLRQLVHESVYNDAFNCD